jgi:arylsulfatase A-like enzyme
MARRLSERGVRFIQLYHPGWDHHSDLQANFETNAREIDQPCAALLEDLRQRDMLKDTLVVFGTEFGRTAYGQGSFEKNSQGREHHRNAFTFWLAGAGVKPGTTHGVTDDFGFHVDDGKVHVNDLHATMLHLLGVDHERFTYRFQGRDYRLTNVAGELVKPILA